MFIKQEVQKFDDSAGIEFAQTPPATWNMSPDFHTLDMSLLKQQWQFVTSIDQLQRIGSFVSGDFCGEPYFIIRNEKNEIKAFFNVCKHHAALLLQGQGCTSEIICPYHAWTYDLNGQLKKAPQMAGVKNFDREALSLKEIPVKIFSQFVLLNFSEKIPEFDTELTKLSQILANAGTEKLRFRERKIYEIKCNWKVYIDNYLDGGYHVNHLHAGLAGQLDMENYRIENFKRWTLQSCGGSKNPTTSQSIDFRERIGDEAQYAWVYPNFMINRYGPIMDTNWIVPIDHQTCLTIFDYYFKDDAKNDFVEASIAASEQVQTEDVVICESVQKGMASKSYVAGRYSPHLETGEYLFHSLLKNDYLRITSDKL